MTYREAVVGKPRELKMPYMPSEASERALYASSMAMPFGGALSIGLVASPVLGALGLGIAGLGGLVYQRTRKPPIRFILDDVALEVVWPPGAVHGSALRLARHDGWDATFGARAAGTFTIYLVQGGAKYLEVNDAPTPSMAMVQCQRLRTFLASGSPR